VYLFILKETVILPVCEGIHSGTVLCSCRIWSFIIWHEQQENISIIKCSECVLCFLCFNLHYTNFGPNCSLWI